MALSGVGQNFYRNNVETTKNVNSAEKFALEETGNTKELTEAEEMEAFKKEFYAELESGIIIPDLISFLRMNLNNIPE